MKPNLTKASAKKAAMRPPLGRFAVVGVVGLVYRDSGDAYPGQVDDLADWSEKLDALLLPPEGRGGKALVRLWHSERSPVYDPWLVEDARSFFQLQLFAPGP